jgi:hypothetical protein
MKLQDISWRRLKQPKYTYKSINRRFDNHYLNFECIALQLIDNIMKKFHFIEDYSHRKGQKIVK